MAGIDRAPAGSITLERGSLYLSAEIYTRYFAGLDAVILLERDSHLYILPVRNTSGGGYLLKLINPEGDRVVNAMDFFRERDKDCFEKLSVEFVWDSEMMALRSDRFFAM